MSEQDGAQSSTKQRRNRKTSSDNHQKGKQVRATQRPVNDDKEAWKAYWETQEQPWRTEPEIDDERKKYLATCYTIVPDIEKGIYPFKGIKLSRADIEWLLAKQVEQNGIIKWDYTYQGRCKGLDLRGADLRSADLHSLSLGCICGGLSRVGEVNPALKAQGAAVHLEEANLSNVHLEGADLMGAHLEGANLYGAHLEGADLYGAHLEGVYFKNAFLGGASLRCSFLDAATDCRNVKLKDEKLGPLLLGDAHWRDVNLARANWTQIKILGDEAEARSLNKWNGEIKNKTDWIISYQWAVRANRQLAVVLRDQGLNEDAARFAYRAQLMQRKLFWHELKFGQYFFSLCLDIFAGYGYKPLQSFIVYALVISIFTSIYYLLGSHLAWNEAIVISMTAFHGRGFFPDQFHPGDPQALVAAIEAFVGLLIEVTFIATLTQRLFGK